MLKKEKKKQRHDIDRLKNKKKRQKMQKKGNGKDLTLKTRF